MRRGLGRLLLHPLGWRAEGRPPGLSKYVLIAAPHTSAWDLPLMLAFSWLFELRIQFLATRGIFPGPAGGVVRALGGIPVDRSARNALVERMADEFARRERLVLAIAPEGSRYRRECWRSGFYWIAREAGVPIVPSYLDYGRRKAGFGPPLWPGTSLRADMDRVRSFYEGRRGLRPEGFGPVRLREEGPRAEGA